MKCVLLAVGKKHDPKLLSAIEDYTTRLNHYCPTSWKLVEAKITSSMSPAETKQKESDLLSSCITPSDTVILLDETGVELSSEEHAQKIQRYRNEGTRTLVFLIGGAFGVTDELKQRADFIWSLSKLVFPHQLVRVVLIEQLYRAFTILNNEKYHHA